VARGGRYERTRGSPKTVPKDASQILEGTKKRPGVKKKKRNNKRKKSENKRLAEGAEEE